MGNPSVFIITCNRTQYGRILSLLFSNNLLKKEKNIVDRLCVEIQVKISKNIAEWNGSDSQKKMLRIILCCNPG